MFSQSDTFQALQKPINKIELMIRDPLLSQFKYHFIIKRLPIFNIVNENFRWNQFILNLYKGFNAQFMGHNSIQIVQVLRTFPETNQIDIIVGLRRDQQALKFFRQIHVFQYQTRKYQIEVADGFRTYLDDLNQRYRKQAAEFQLARAQQNPNYNQFQTIDKQKQDSPIFLKVKSSLTQKSHLDILKKASGLSRQSIALSPDLISEYSARNLIVKTTNVRRKNSSDSSRSNSYSSYSRSKIQSASKSSYQSKNRGISYRNKVQFQQNKSQKKSSSSSNSRRSSNSKNSSRSSYKEYNKGRNVHRNERSRQKKKYRRSSSRQSQNSQKNRYFKKQSPEYQKKQYGYRDQRDRRFEQNKKYEIYPPYNRSYSGNYDNRYRNGPVQLTKKLSYQSYNHSQSYNNYRPNGNRQVNSSYIDYPKSNTGYGYLKPTEGYNNYIKPPVSGQYDVKVPLNSNPNPNKYSDNNNYRYANKNSYHSKNQSHYQ